MDGDLSDVRHRRDGEGCCSLSDSRSSAVPRCPSAPFVHGLT